MGNNTNRKSANFQEDTSNCYGFVQIFVHTTKHHLEGRCPSREQIPLRVLVHEIGGVINVTDNKILLSYGKQTVTIGSTLRANPTF